MKKIVLMALTALLVGILPANAQLTSGPATVLGYGEKGVQLIQGTADQIYAENHTATGSEMKTVTSTNGTLVITPSTGGLDFAIAGRTVVSSSSTGTVTLAVNTLNILSGSGAVADFPAAASFSGGSIVVVNSGSGNITLTPASGTINAGSTVTLATHTAAIVYSDGTNLHALTGITAQ